MVGLALFDSVLRLRVFDRLPLHIARSVVRATSSQRHYVIDYVALAPARSSAGGWARLLVLDLRLAAVDRAIRPLALRAQDSQRLLDCDPVRRTHGRSHLRRATATNYPLSNQRMPFCVKSCTLSDGSIV
jgi:hypothetical protein